MRKFRLKEQEEAESIIDLTPMLDIVFIMLIFFIVTTTFIKSSNIEIDRPSAKFKSQSTKEDNLIISIDRDSNIWIDSKIVYLESLKSRLKELKVENLNVLVEADENLKTRELIEVVDIVKLSRAKSLSIATERK